MIQKHHQTVTGAQGPTPSGKSPTGGSLIESLNCCACTIVVFSVKKIVEGSSEQKLHFRNRPFTFTFFSSISASVYFFDCQHECTQNKTKTTQFDFAAPPFLGGGGAWDVVATMPTFGPRRWQGFCSQFDFHPFFGGSPRRQVLYSHLPTCAPPRWQGCSSRFPPFAWHFFGGGGPQDNNGYAAMLTTRKPPRWQGYVATSDFLPVLGVGDT